jgi:hypothetical protein
MFFFSTFVSTYWKVGDSVTKRQPRDHSNASTPAESYWDDSGEQLLSDPRHAGHGPQGPRATWG